MNDWDSVLACKASDLGNCLARICNGDVDKVDHIIVDFGNGISTTMARIKIWYKKC